jgi:starch synthase (maltosyl-transferring)
MKLRQKMIIYNLFPLLVGKFTDWTKHLERAVQMGFNWVFINPVQLPGSSGSLYSIVDYSQLNPLFVDPKSKKSPEQQLTDIIETAENLGLRMMIDLVVNHCSVDSDLLKTHPRWFQWESDGRVAHPFADEDGKKVVWKDLAKFDHRNTEDKEGLYQFFLNVVKSLIGMGFKGFRCDAAYQIPGIFWERLISEIKKAYPEVFFFAETLGCTPDLTMQTASAGFDYIFNSSKWWDFKSLWLMKQYVITRETVRSISFPESHDTVRLCEELNGNIDGIKQRYMFSALFSAGVMMPIGFEFGFRKKLHVVKTRPNDWEQTNIDLRPFITQMNKIKSEYDVFQEEAPSEIMHYNNENILLMWKASMDVIEESLLILNKDIYNKQHFYTEKLQEYFHAVAPLVDISPEYPLNYLPVPFLYDLRPGQGILLLSSLEAPEE